MFWFYLPIYFPHTQLRLSLSSSTTNIHASGSIVPHSIIYIRHYFSPVMNHDSGSISLVITAPHTSLLVFEVGFGAEVGLGLGLGLGFRYMVQV